MAVSTQKGKLTSIDSTRIKPFQDILDSISNNTSNSKNGTQMLYLIARYQIFRCIHHSSCKWWWFTLVNFSFRTKIPSDHYIGLGTTKGLDIDEWVREWLDVRVRIVTALIIVIYKSINQSIIRETIRITLFMEYKKTNY